MPIQSTQHVLSPRSVELLKAAAVTLNDISDPFHDSFLAEHHVTGDEVIALSTHMAIAVRALVTATRPEQHRLLLAGLADGEDPAVDALLVAAGQLAYTRAAGDEALAGIAAFGAPEPTILQHFGDRIDLQCECGNELTWVDQTSDRLECNCGRTIEVEVITKVRYA